MRVALVFRDSTTGGKSIEEIFRGISLYLKGKVDSCTFEYNNQKSFWWNVFAARRTKADVFHISGGVYFLAYGLWSRKVILTIHDIGRFKELSGLRKWMYGLVLLKGPMMIADVITVVSTYTSLDVQRYFGNRIFKKVQIIPNPGPAMFAFSPANFNSIQPRLLHIGTSENKNLFSVIKALQGIKCTLVIIGKLADREKHILAQNAIHYENKVDLSYEQIYEEYVKADIVLFVSLHEGFGMPVVEAQMTGRPVIASRTTSIPEIGGEGVLYVDNPLDVGEIKRAVEKVIIDVSMREELIQKGLENAKRFHLSEVADAYIQLYKHISGKS